MKYISDIVCHIYTVRDKQSNTKFMILKSKLLEALILKSRRLR